MTYEAPSAKQKRYELSGRVRVTRERGREKFGAARDQLIWQFYAKTSEQFANYASAVDYVHADDPFRISRDPDFLIAWALNGRDLPPGVTLDELACLLAVSGYAGVEARIAEALEIGT